MNVRETKEPDWKELKKIRLAALLDSPTAFGVSYQTAIDDSDEKWKQRATPEILPKFWLAFNDNKAVGIIGAGIDPIKRFNLIAMWVQPESRGIGLGDLLVNTVKSEAIKMGFKKIYLDVSPNNSYAVRFYQKNGFIFINEDKSLASHPDIKVQTMIWESIF